MEYDRRRPILPMNGNLIAVSKSFNRRAAGTDCLSSLCQPAINVGGRQGPVSPVAGQRASDAKLWPTSAKFT